MHVLRILGLTRLFCLNTAVAVPQYSSPARQAGDDELCVRQLSLIVLFYEAIVDDVLDYDYAHIAVLVCHKGISKMVWMNVSQVVMMMVAFLVVD